MPHIIVYPQTNHAEKELEVATHSNQNRPQAVWDNDAWKSLRTQISGQLSQVGNALDPPITFEVTGFCGRVPSSWEEPGSSDSIFFKATAALAGKEKVRVYAWITGHTINIRIPVFERVLTHVDRTVVGSTIHITERTKLVASALIYEFIKHEINFIHHLLDAEDEIEKNPNRLGYATILRINPETF